MKQVPQHPYLARNGASNIHNDAYQTDAYNAPGPLGRDPEVTSTMFAAECASVTFDRKGRIVTVCVSPTGATLRMLDPKTLAFPKSRRTTLTTLIATLAAGEIDLGAGADWDRAREQLALRAAGIFRWIRGRPRVRAWPGRTGPRRRQ